MPEDLGKDLNSVDRLKRLHETFEADLAPLEKQVRMYEIRYQFGLNEKRFTTLYKDVSWSGKTSKRLK
jgi:hypothetical protein